MKPDPLTPEEASANLQEAKLRHAAHTITQLRVENEMLRLAYQQVATENMRLQRLDAIRAFLADRERGDGAGNVVAFSGRAGA